MSVNIITNQHTKLSDALRQAFKQNGISIESASSQIGVPSPSLRSWLRGNKFPSDLVTQLIDLASLTDFQAPSERFAFQTTRPKVSKSESVRKNNLLRIQKLWSIRSSNLERVIRTDFRTDMCEIFNALNQDDTICTVSSTEIPVEWDDVEIRYVQKEFLKALTSGTSFIYLCPSQTLKTSLEALVNHPVPDYAVRFSRFRNRVEQLLLEEFGESKANKIKSLNYVECDSPWFLMPGFKFTLLLPHEPTTRITSFMAAPTSGNTRLHMQMELEWTKSLYRCLAGIIKHSSIPDDVKSLFS